MTPRESGTAGSSRKRRISASSTVRLAVKNDENCIENDEICIENDEFCTWLYELRELLPEPVQRADPEVALVRLVQPPEQVVGLPLARRRVQQAGGQQPGGGHRGGHVGVDIPDILALQGALVALAYELVVPEEQCAAEQRRRVLRARVAAAAAHCGVPSCAPCSAAAVRRLVRCASAGPTCRPPARLRHRDPGTRTIQAQTSAAPARR